jgi:hypothetical protein
MFAGASRDLHAVNITMTVLHVNGLMTDGRVVARLTHLLARDSTQSSHARSNAEIDNLVAAVDDRLLDLIEHPVAGQVPGQLRRRQDAEGVHGQGRLVHGGACGDQAAEYGAGDTGALIDVVRIGWLGRQIGHVSRKENRGRRIEATVEHGDRGAIRTGEVSPGG